MTKRIHLLWLAIFACASLTAAAQADKRAAELDRYFSGHAKHFRFNGNVLVAEQGKVIYQKSFGYADFSTKRLLNDSSVFELGSVSKQFTAAAILSLSDQGKLRLTDSLRQYFPELPYHNITIRHMLTHTSGLPDYFDAMVERWPADKIAFNRDMIGFLAKENLPIEFTPGSKWAYSNTAYALLASIVEKVSGKSFAQYLKATFFDPLGMTHSEVYNTRRSSAYRIPNYAYGFTYSDSLKRYVLPDSLKETSYVISLDGITGDGTVNATNMDLLKWDRSLKDAKILKPASAAAMLSGQEIVDTANNIMYGYGVRVEQKQDGKFISHSGGWPGYVTFLGRLEQPDRTIAILSNVENNSPAFADAVLAILARRAVDMPYEHKAVALDSASLIKLTGEYEGSRSITVFSKGGKLYSKGQRGREMELIPESATRFFFADGSDRQLEFETDGSGRAIRVWQINYGIRSNMRRKD